MNLISLISDSKFVWATMYQIKCLLSGVPAVRPPDLLRAVRPRPQGLPPLPPAHPRHCKDLHVLKQESHFSVQKS